MADTYQFGLPLIAAGQAQKHVTVNEGMAVLDAISQLRLVSATTSAPPVVAQEGSAYLVPTGASGDWATHEGKIAVAVNGGWRYVTPKAGWQAFNGEIGRHLLFDGTDWRDSAIAATASGAALEYHIAEIDHTLDAASVSETAPVIPANAQVIAVSGRIISEITGTFSTWSLGVAGSTNRYGSGLGGALNSYITGLTGTPVSYYSPTTLLLTPDSGSFTGGAVRLAVNYLTVQPPRPI